MSNLSSKFSGFAKLDLLYGGKTINPIHTMHAHINLFFTHLEYSENELPFQEVKDILLTAKSPVKALEEFHRKFAAVMYRIFAAAMGVDELFNELIRHNKMLTKIVDYLGLEDLGLFKLGDTMIYSKLVNLALYMLAASDFDFEIMSSMTCEILQFDCLTPTPGCIVEFNSSRWFKYKEAAKVHESSFHRKVLNMKRDETFELVQIKANFEYHERRDYYQQFEEPIYEEIRKGIDQAMIALANGREKKMNLSLKLKKWKIEDDNDIQVFQCLIDSMDSKLLDHSPNEEVVLLTFYRPQKNGAKPSVKPQIRGILTDFDMDEKTKKYVSCKLLMSSVDYFQYSNDKQMFSVRNPIYVNFLISVMSFGRMLGACVNPPRNCGIVESIVTGNLPLWGADFNGSRSFAFNAGAMAMVSNCELNSKQAEAICDFAAAPRGLYLLQGPPGTGKTTTIIHLLKHMLEINPVQRIMLCAPSNAAVHILAERAMEVLGRDVSMVLHGVDKNMSKTLRHIYCNNITKRLSSEIKDYSDRLELLQKSTSNYNNAAFLTLVDDLSDVFIAHQLFFASIQARFIAIIATDSNNNNTILRFDHLIDMRDAILKLLKAVDSQFIVMRQAISDFPNPCKQEQVACIVSSLNDYCQIVKSSSTQYESHLEVFMLSQSQLIFTTLVSSGSKIMRKNIHDIDVLIIDEAGQAVEPELLIPNNFNPRKCLQVGDNKQLPATVLSDENKVILYDQSMMSRLIERARAIPKMLEIQYRMHPAICAWPSSMYYNDLLRADESLLQRCSIVQHTAVCDYLRSPCVFIDVDGVELGKQNHDTSYKNLAEAECAVSILKHLLKKNVPPGSIGIIAFYSSQVALLDEKTRFLEVDGVKSVKISTVDSFQGMERDIIILCTTRTCKSAGFLRDFRRINVAATRAKHNLYVLGKTRVLEESNTDLSLMIQHYKNHDGCKHLNSTGLLALISETN